MGRIVLDSGPSPVGRDGGRCVLTSQWDWSDPVWSGWAPRALRIVAARTEPRPPEGCGGSDGASPSRGNGPSLLRCRGKDSAMGSTSRMPVWITIVALAAASAAGLLIVAGCTLDKTESRP